MLCEMTLGSDRLMVGHEDVMWAAAACSHRQLGRCRFVQSEGSEECCVTFIYYPILTHMLLFVMPSIDDEGDGVYVVGCMTGTRAYVMHGYVRMLYVPSFLLQAFKC